MKKIKKYISIMLSVGMLLALFIVPVNASTQSRYYTDVYTSDSYYEAAMYLNEHNIMLGYTTTSFAPSGNITRGEVVTILWRMLNRPVPDGTVSMFSDCSSDDFYYNAVRWACSTNVAIASGYGDNTFQPSRIVTNQELLSFMYRFACYCGYASKTDEAKANYKAVFEASSLVYKSTFADYGLAPAGWACQDGFISNNNVQGTSNATRGETAEYIYHFYKQYQRKYGLAVVNTTDMSYVSVCDDAMKTLFSHYNATTLNYENLTKASFITAMSNAFQNAKGLDICYLYCASHGGTSGLALFSGSTRILTPTFLREQIDLYKGTFVVFVSGCHTGTYISSEDGSGESVYVEDEFDTEAFVKELTDTDSLFVAESDLRDGSRIKILCSSRKDELSYSTDRLATNYWCLGSGYDFHNAVFTTLYADDNSDNRVSLEELYIYSHDEILDDLSQIGIEQNVVRYPYEDSFVIFESSY